jgi:hypothetical protein
VGILIDHLIFTVAQIAAVSSHLNIMRFRQCWNMLIDLNRFFLPDIFGNSVPFGKYSSLWDYSVQGSQALQELNMERFKSVSAQILKINH